MGQQLFVVTDKKERVYIFDNHDAALRCRRGLKLNHWHLFGCGINNDWRNGAPVCPVSSSRDEERKS